MWEQREVVLHSELSEWDGSSVIIGPKNPAQLDKYATSTSRGKLPLGLWEEPNRLWELVKGDVAPIVVF